MLDTSASERYKQLALSWNHEDLAGIWDRVKSRSDVPGFPPGKAFEYLVIRAFVLEGARVRWPYEVIYPQKFGTMEQIDGLVYLDQRAFLVESKALTEPAAIEAIAKLRHRLEGRPPGTMSILFSLNDFSTPAEVFAQFASPLNVLLWGRADLDIAFRERSMLEALRQKLAYAIEEGLPLYPLGGPV